MNFKKNDIESLEKIEKLSFSDDEKNKINDNLSFWVEKFEKMSEINTDNIEPLISVFTYTNVFREDIAKKMTSKQEVLKNAPEENNGYFQVPKTI